MYRDVLPIRMYVHRICAGPVEARGDVMFSFVSLSWGCWNSSLGPLKKQVVFLTTEPSLQSPIMKF